MNISEWITRIDGFIWGIPLMVLLVGTGIYLTCRKGFIQFRCLKHAVNVVRGRYDDPHDPGEISHFQALCSALSATIGLGNIVGVAAVITLGGPGAVFWMWITALFGMATKFASCTLAVRYRKIDETGEAHGGPMHFIATGMGPKFKWLAVLFAFFTICASFGIGNMFQINNMTASMKMLLFRDVADNSLIDLSIGVAVALLVGSVILGGIKSIARVVSKIVPFMCVFYILGGLVILVMNYDKIISAFGTIFYYAFHAPESVTGGLLGAVVRQGVARGLFSNEAGMGSAAIAHGAAKTDEPVREGLVAMLGPFIDTILICSMTAIVIIITGSYETCQNKAELTSKAFEMGLGSAWGSKFVLAAMIFFAFSTLISWSYYGDRATDFLFGKKAVRPYRFTYLCFIVLGACATIDVVIDFCDAMNGLMAIPNLIALIFFSGQIATMTKDYIKRQKNSQQTN